MKNVVSEVGQYSGWGPEATCMHPQDNNTPPSLPPCTVSYHRRLYTAELMEGLALMKEHKGLDELSAIGLSHKGSHLQTLEQLGKDQLSRAYS